ncbi:DUF1571 domain-containing protein [Lignipirellula cremea]|uniref:DUF1571 domain-containing protein n=1 Tax=Lignipirellula cremea TaxID=2528010 RepID=A0A518DUQ8_9BACT|nr:DUF1571 domain-containing protein [Lignipirellula cremea]QDU95558.1 hypothetical protein Pla8534_33730 [Lignipirellula cremea]
MTYGNMLRAATLVLFVWAASPKAVVSGQDSPATIQQRVLKVEASADDPLVNHPLTPVLRFAYRRLAALEVDIRDFTCTLIKRERINGELSGYQYIDLKVRTRQEEANGVTPLSVYARFTKPASVAGREVLFVENKNEGKVLARRGGTRLSYVTTSVEPDGPLALRDSRNPITEVGICNLIRRLIERAESDIQHDEVHVAYYKDSRINDRPCTQIVVTHPVPRDYFLFSRAEIFIDNEMNIPVRYVAYTWPTQPGGPELLQEEFTYTNLQLNVGLADADFSAENPAYMFYRRDDEDAGDK